MIVMLQNFLSNFYHLMWLGVFTSRSGSGLCPTRDRPVGLGWRTFWSAADRRESRIGVVGFSPETRLVRLKPSTVKNPAKIVDFKPKCARVGRNLTGSGEILLDPVRFPPNLAEISLDLVTSPKIRPKSHKNLRYFDQKLAGKFLFRQISLKLRSGRLRRVLEERTRHPTRRTRFLGFATRRRPLELTDRSRVGRFRSGLVGWIGFGSSWTPLNVTMNIIIQKKKMWQWIYFLFNWRLIYLFGDK